MKTLATILLTFFLAIPGIQNGQNEEKVTITVTIEGIRNSSGSVGVALHSEETGFPEGEPLKMETVSLDGSGSVEVIFKDVPAGDYAVAVMHDENDNGDIDFNDYGMPTEGFGFSNDAMGEMGPPDFDDAAFTAEGDTDVWVSLIYMGA